jgi:hypothetical protein
MLNKSSVPCFPFVFIVFLSGSVVNFSGVGLTDLRIFSFIFEELLDNFSSFISCFFPLLDLATFSLSMFKSLSAFLYNKKSSNY